MAVGAGGQPARRVPRFTRELQAAAGDCLVLPSHGLPFRGLRERIDQLIGHHQERLERALEACATPLTLAEVMPRLFDRALDVHQLQFALGESLAHLNFLVEQGRLERQTDGDGRVRYCACAGY